MTFIASARAQETISTVSSPVPTSAATLPPAPGAGEAFLWNMGMVAVLAALFYVLLVMPQQRRFREHSRMLSNLKKGDRVSTGGGLIGTIEKISEESNEVTIDLGGGTKVLATRASLQAYQEPAKKKAATSGKK
ncbi:MAG: preprotein translocase subunit YajC [Alphaproteobacteria bacterium]|nr:preprotein translocase subunit YajC [Alphaproteobacteria bacterium]